MNNLAKHLVKTSGFVLLVVTIFSPMEAKAQEDRVLECVKKYTATGVSADAALSQCTKMNLGNCIEKAMKQNVVATAVKKSEDEGYLIDLGDNESRWLEGPSWESKGCKAYTEGPYKRQSDDLRAEGIFGGGRSFEWFRQGWCGKDKIFLDQFYSLEEAKILCETGQSIPQMNDTNNKSQRYKN